jgi:hypothetical protein
VSQPKSTTSSQEEQNDEAKKNGLDDTSVPVSALPSQSYFSDHGNSEATDDDVTQKDG